MHGLVMKAEHQSLKGKGLPGGTSRQRELGMDKEEYES
jgi:hypothetical protein